MARQYQPARPRLAGVGLLCSSGHSGPGKTLGLQTDASTRFERGVDPTGQRRALERASGLLLAIAGGVPGPCRMEGSVAASCRPVILRRSRLALVLGEAVPDRDVVSILSRLGMQVTETGDGWQVQAPAFRFDIAIEVDLIEEIARVRGYDRIAPRQGIQATTLGSAPSTRVGAGSLRAALVQRGYQEAMTYSFVDREQDAFWPAARRAFRSSIHYRRTLQSCARASARARPRAPAQHLAPTTAGPAVRDGRPVHSRSAA